MNTNKKILFLQKYIRKNYKRLFSLDTENIVGIRIDKKESRVNRKNSAPKKRKRYAIVFQVEVKLRENKLLLSNVLPKFLKIKFPDGTIKAIPTDVEATGLPGFHLSKCDMPLSNGSNDQGTIGLFVLDDSGECYGITNYHVAALDRMKNDEFEFEGSDGRISVDNNAAEFVEGVLSEELDVAFIRCPSMDDNDLVNQLSDDLEIDSFIKGPITPNFKNKKASVFIGSSNLERKVIINNNSAIFDTKFKGIKLVDVIQLSPRVTSKGDSGSPVLMNSSIIGIITGGDDKYSYAIPYYKIRNYKKMDIP